MIVCPRCSVPNDPAQTVCWGCGLPLGQQAPPPAGHNMGATMVQGSPPAAPAPAAPAPVAPAPAAAPPAAPPANAPRVVKTMLGIAPAQQASQPTAPGAVSASAKQTMLGIAPVHPSAQAPPRPPAAAGKHTLLGVAPPSTPPPAPDAGGKHTLLGVAPPSTPPPAAPDAGGKQTLLGVAPQHGRKEQLMKTQPLHTPQAPHAPAPQAQASHPPSQPPMASEKKTVLGVARPGIAPLNPGVAKPPSVPPPAVPTPAPKAHAAAAQGKPASQLRSNGPTTEDLAVLPGHGKKASSLWLPIGLLVGAVVLAAGAVAGFLLLRAAPALDARVGVDAQGRETLQLVCAKCEDGAQARLSGARASFAAGKALLTLEQPLRIGKNELSVEIERPGGSVRIAEIEVPVEYRVRGDFEPLAGSPPKLAVRVEAVLGTAVVIDGQAVMLSPNGVGKHLVDVAKELSGPAPRVEPLERKLAYSITPPGSPPQTGEVVLRLGIAALVVDAPGAKVVTESPNFMLAGRTLKGGAITVEGRPITVDAQGRFAQLMNVSAVGQTTINVRASAPDHAPRLFPVEVRRVDSLRAEAQRFSARASDSYSAVSSNIARKRGWAVALPGRISDVRSEGHTSVLLLEVSKGCDRKPCLARLLYGARPTVSKGDRVTAYGHITGAVAGARRGDEIPEVRVDFLLPDTP